MNYDSRIKKRIESFPLEAWIRTCQECNNIQIDKEPSQENGGLTDTYRNRKCKKCKSEALDFGTQNVYYDYMED